MRGSSQIAFCFLMVAACSDPLKGIERESDGAVLPSGDTASVLPTQDETDRETSVFQDLFHDSEVDAQVKTQVADTGAEPVIVVQDVVTNAAERPDARAQAAQPQRRTLVGWLRRAAEAENTATSGTADTQLRQASATASQLPKADDDATLARRPIEPVASTAPGATRNAPIITRSGDDKSQTDGVTLRDVDLGIHLPFGEVGRVCDARPQDLGHRIEHVAQKGVGYALYDSAPGTASVRTFYVTGFSDNCVRQFTASLAIFGSPEFHEQLRYGLPAEEYPYSVTDAAYETVKSRVCRVASNRPCGDRISQLKNTTVFVSVYEHFNDNARWADMLLHDGALLAAALKTP